MEQLITKQIRSSPSIEALEGVFTQWGGSFNLSHTAASLTRLAKLKKSRDSKLPQLLPRKWLQLLPEAGSRQCVSALCACITLSEEFITLWAPTWAAFMQHVQGGSGDGLVPQDLADAVDAATRLRKHPGPRELQLLTRKWLQLLPAAGARQCASAVHACVTLSKEQADAVWAPTWAAFMQHVQQGSGEGLTARDIADAVGVAATLLKKPGPGELQLLVQIFLRLEGLTGASARIARLVEQIEKLSQVPGWQGGIRQQDMQQLLGVQRRLLTQRIGAAKTVKQLQHICYGLDGSFQVSHTAAALRKFNKLSRTCSWDNNRDGPVLQQLVHKWLQQLPTAGVRDCSNALFACGRFSQEHVDAVWAPTWAAFMQHVQRG